MTVEKLTKHICDTVKEWQIKIGYREEQMKLYYPAVSLKSLLELDEKEENNLDVQLQKYSTLLEEKLGKIEISSDEKKERYCLNIPVKGVSYIANCIPDSQFLKDFLEIITSPLGKLEDIRMCFRKHAENTRAVFYEIDQTGQGLGHVFYFEGNAEEDYVYCVEQDDFGLTYHRFDKMDYKKMLEDGEGLHEHHHYNN